MDAAEFKQQFLPYHRKLYRVAFRLTGNPQDAEDMVQEAYLKLWNKRDELADVLMYLVRLSSVLGIDLNEAVTQKLASNGRKYPVDKARSNSKKYDRL